MKHLKLVTFILSTFSSILFAERSKWPNVISLAFLTSLRPKSGISSPQCSSAISSPRRSCSHSMVPLISRIFLPTNVSTSKLSLPSINCPFNWSFNWTRILFSQESSQSWSLGNLRLATVHSSSSWFFNSSINSTWKRQFDSSISSSTSNLFTLSSLFSKTSSMFNSIFRQSFRRTSSCSFRYVHLSFIEIIQSRVRISGFEDHFACHLSISSRRAIALWRRFTFASSSSRSITDL